eukprot:jgi/Ulvmu1/8548/UM044_0082.1
MLEVAVLLVSFIRVEAAAVLSQNDSQDCGRKAALPVANFRATSQQRVRHRASIARTTLVLPIRPGNWPCGKNGQAAQGVRDKQLRLARGSPTALTPIYGHANVGHRLSVTQISWWSTTGQASPKLKLH